MNATDPGAERALLEQKAAMRRARAQGRRWYLRAFLMVVISAVAFERGGQLNDAIGLVLILLAALSWSLGRSLRRSAAAMAAKIRLLEAP